MSDTADHQAAATGAVCEALGAPKSADYRAGAIFGLRLAITLATQSLDRYRAPGAVMEHGVSGAEAWSVGFTDATLFLETDLEAEIKTLSKSAPKSAPIVTGEMAEAALDAWFADEPWNYWRSHGEIVDDWRRDMRAAITAALAVRDGGDAPHAAPCALPICDDAGGGP